MTKFNLFIMLLVTATILSSCGESQQSEQKDSSQEALAVPGMTSEQFHHLLNNVTNIEYIFFDYPISFSQSETNAVRQAVMFIEMETARPDDNCEPTAMVMFMGGGEILAEGNIYFMGDCSYFVFEKDREAAYFHSLSPTGHQFYNSVLTNYFNQLQQRQQQ